MRQRVITFPVVLILVGVGPTLGRAEADPRRTLRVPADEAWTDTGLEVQQGGPLRIEASGMARMIRMPMWGWFSDDTEWCVGPRGTYRWPPLPQVAGRDQVRAFPLPAMADGPHPAFCLIGKLGEDGAPFYVGERFDGVADRRGRLWLGINDDRFDDNSGHFQVIVELDRRPRPADAQRVASTSHPPPPGAKRRLLLLYIDGLRPDVLHEMAAQGFLPHLQRVFLDGGLECVNAFTVFPSNTLIANGSLFTGRFSDRTGIKSQNQFERATLKPRGHLSEWLPDWLLLRSTPQTSVVNLLDKFAPEHTEQFLRKRGIRTLGSRFGNAYRFTVLPMAPLNPPPQWFHRAMNTLGPFGISTRLSQQLDRVNAQYAMDELIGDEDAEVIAVWFPMVDKTCHHSRRGQFGAARRDLALADWSFGRILDRLRQMGWDRSTFFLLVSDHGHLGGERGANRRCNLPRDWAHRTLGCNVRVVGQEWTHPGINPERFLFFDHQGAGQAKLFLPYGSYLTGPWRRNRLYELTHYQIRAGQRDVNLLESLTAFPIDLILVKLDRQQVLVYRDPDCQAIIHREQAPSGEEVYRYEPVRRMVQSEDGAFQRDPPRPGVDPFGYLADPRLAGEGRAPAWVSQPHTAEEWLRATFETRYPDAIVAIAKFFAWQPPVEDLAEVRDPDLVVTAAEGWSFRSDDGEGTDHGAPLAPSMRITLILAGPGIAPGRLEEPQRIVSVVPTILELMGRPYDPREFDGRAIPLPLHE